MLLIIFGAGATYDCEPQLQGFRSSHYPPPLAKDLFDGRPDFGRVINSFPPVRPLVQSLQAAASDGSVSIEHEFERIVAEAQRSARVKRQLTATRYYLHDAIQVSADIASASVDGVTNYHQLVNRIAASLEPAGRPVAFLTFNYDQLLEHAITDTTGQHFDDMAAYVNNESLRVIKIHGSVNWRRRLDGLSAPWSGGSPEQNAEWILDRSASLKPTDDFEVGSPHTFVQGQPVAIPAIAVPTEHKTPDNFEVPLAHLEALRALLPVVSQVLIVGWRGREEHFWQLWNERRPPGVRMNVVVVDADEDQARGVAKTVIANGLSTDVQSLGVAGFTGYLREKGLPGLLLG